MDATIIYDLFKKSYFNVSYRQYTGFVGFCQDKIQGHFKDSTSEFKDILNGDKLIF